MESGSAGSHTFGSIFCFVCSACFVSPVTQRFLEAHDKLLFDSPTHPEINLDNTATCNDRYSHLNAYFNSGLSGRSG